MIILFRAWRQYNKIIWKDNAVRFFNFYTFIKYVKRL